MEEKSLKNARLLAGFLVAAFDELHTAVLERIADPSQNFSTHFNYPTMSLMGSGFPSFSEHGFYSKIAPKDYVGVLRPAGIIGALLGVYHQMGFPKCDELVEWLKGNELGKRIIVEDDFPGREVEQIVATSVERYIHLYGTGPVDKEKRGNVLNPIFCGMVKNTYRLSVMVPIALTHFEVDHFRLNENSYITRIPKGLQLARSRMDRRGSGAVANVVGAATHAFVSTAWEMPASTIQSVRDGLNDPSRNVLEEVDSFFAALRAATGAITGYGQVCMVPRRWTFGFFVDLPPLFGATYRRYPNSFDDYGWAYGGQSVVTASEMEDVRRVYDLIRVRTEERVSVALKRLNSCMTRDDAVDAILDATIGLEVLLGDMENQALSYKLRVRAAALAKLNGARSPSDVFETVKRIYKVRSTIVHGLRTKKAKQLLSKPEEERYVDERETAADMLRFVVNILLEHPVYLDPHKIDGDLLIEPPTSDIPLCDNK